MKYSFCSQYFSVERAINQAKQRHPIYIYLNIFHIFVCIFYFRFFFHCRIPHSFIFCLPRVLLLFIYYYLLFFYFSSIFVASSIYFGKLSRFTRMTCIFSLNQNIYTYRYCNISSIYVYECVIKSYELFS